MCSSDLGIGWVPQHPKLAQGSIRKQFELIAPGISDLEIIHYLDLVALNVRDLPSGLDSILESGSELMSAASGGQIRKVAIARALVHKPKLLIADEPTTALDVTIQAEVLDLLRGLQDRFHMGILLVTHNFGVVADLCDRVVVMQYGEVVESGDVRTILKSPKEAYTQELLGSMLVDKEPLTFLVSGKGK